MMEPVKDNKDPKDFFISEIESHESHMADWWSLKGTMKALHTMNKLRLPFIRKGLVATKRISEIQAAKPKFLEGLKVLDVGCGGGILSEALAQAGGTVVGVDPSAGLTNLAKEHATRMDTPPPQYICDTIENHSVQFAHYYDVVVASEVVEHVPNKQTFLTACIAALKPGGSLFVTTPNRTAMSWLGGILVCEDILRIVPRGFHSWQQFIHHRDLTAMISGLGCDVRKVKGMFYDPLMNKWCWCFTPTFIYAVHSVKQG